MGFAVAAVLCLVSTASGHSAPGRDLRAAVSRPARPSDLLPKPRPCGTKGANLESCLLTSTVGTLRISPHVAHPGKVITARIEHFSCIDIPLTGPCPVIWNETGVHALRGSVASYLRPITRCGKADHLCRWRVSKHAKTTRFEVLGANITRSAGVEGVEPFDAIINDYVGILGPKPPPPLPKPLPPTQPIPTPIPPVLPPHRSG